MPHHGDQGHGRHDGQVVRLAVNADLLQKLLFLVVDVRLGHDHRNAVNAGRHVFDGHVIALKHADQLPEEVLLFSKPVLFNGDDAKILAARYARQDGILLFKRLGHDQRARVVRAARIFDVDGDIRLPHRKHGILMQHLRAHVGKLPQLLVGDAADGPGIPHNAGIRHQEARHVGPVFIELRVRSPGDQGPRDVAAAAGEGEDLPLFPAAVEARDHGIGHRGKPLLDQAVGLRRVQNPVRVKAYQLRAVRKGPAQVLSQQEGADVLPAAGAVIPAGPPADLITDAVKRLLQRQGQPKAVFDLLKTAADDIKHILKLQLVAGQLIAHQQHVGDLVVAVIALAGR